jgi:tetratricopeptide (TPR) repeat protein
VERIAAHLCGASPAAERWATEVLLRAAGAVRGLGLPRRAVELLQRALAEPPPAELRKATIADLGRAESVLGLPSGVEHLREALALAEDAEDGAELAADLAMALLGVGRTEEAIAAAETALAGLPSVTGATDRLLLVIYCAAQGQVELSSRLGRWEPRLRNAAESAHTNGGNRRPRSAAPSPSVRWSLGTPARA